jgi:hypothetical protein
MMYKFGDRVRVFNQDRTETHEGIINGIRLHAHRPTEYKIFISSLDVYWTVVEERIAEDSEVLLMFSGGTLTRIIGEHNEVINNPDMDLKIVASALLSMLRSR